MQESLDQEKDVTQMFEEEQEEKAIISYQELVRANLKQEIKEEPRKEEFDIPKIEEDIPILDTKEEKKFKQTDFISVWNKRERKLGRERNYYDTKS